MLESSVLNRQKGVRAAIVHSKYIAGMCRLVFFIAFLAQWRKRDSIGCRLFGQKVGWWAVDDLLGSWFRSLGKKHAESCYVPWLRKRIHRREETLICVSSILYAILILKRNFKDRFIY